MDDYEDALLRLASKLGEIIFEDDRKDFPRFAFDDRAGGGGYHPSPIHHWQLGMAMVYGSAAVRAMLELSDLVDVLVEDGDVFEQLQDVGLVA